MIKIDYFGRYGNQLFQHFFGSILAEQYDTVICTPPPKGFLKIQGYTQYIEKENPRYFQVNDQNMEMCFKDEIEIYDGLHIHGYFQKHVIFNAHREGIKKLCNLEKIPINHDDIVLHLRLTDYWWSRVNAVIHPSYYLNILKQLKWNKVYIVCENHPTNKHYLKYFNGIPNNRKEIISSTPENDFHFIRSFDRIICSNSTFCWWAAFLSDASQIYTFKPWMGPKHPVSSNLAYMDSATVRDGTFITDSNLSRLDWSNYWEKM